MAQLVNFATEDLGSILRTYVKKLSKEAHAYNPCTEEAEMGLLASQLAYLVSSRPVGDSQKQKRKNGHPLASTYMPIDKGAHT